MIYYVEAVHIYQGNYLNFFSWPPFFWCLASVICLLDANDGPSHLRLMT